MNEPRADIYEKLLPPTEPSHRFRQAVLARLERAQARSAWSRFLFDASVALASAVAFVLTGRLFLSDLAGSGAFAYVSAFFADGTSMLTYWREAALSVAEAFPSLAAAAPLAAAAVMLFSLQRAFVNGTSAFHHRKLA